MNAMWLIDKHYVDVHYKAKKRLRKHFTVCKITFNQSLINYSTKVYYL